MNRRWGKSWGFALAAAFAASCAPAQISSGSALSQAVNLEVGGAPSTDVIVLHAIGPCTPLRYGGILAGSEHIDLDGQTLSRGADYSIDYGTGVIYLFRAQRAGQVMTASYRYDASRVKPTTASYAGLTSLQFQIAPGGFNAIAGLGLADRAADGTVSASNVYGLGSNSEFGRWRSHGVLLLGEQTTSDARSGLDAAATRSYSGSSKSELILESLSTKFGGGTASLDYQDVGANMMGLGQAVGAGYDQKTVDQLGKEKGLKRFGLSIADAGVGSLKLTDGYRRVGDDQSSIVWQNFGLRSKTGGFSFGSRESDATFSRFGDLREDDRAQLQAEAGLKRTNFAGDLALGSSKLSLSELQVQDPSTRAGLAKRDWALDSSKFHFAYKTQGIDSGFTRVNSLFEPDKAQWGRELGLQRQAIAMDGALGSASLKFSQSLVQSPSGGLASRDATLSGKTWALQHIDRSSSAGFASLGSLSSQEQDQNVSAILSMYGLKSPGPTDKASYLGLNGISRRYDALQYHPGKSWSAQFSFLSLGGQLDRASVASYAVSTAKSQFSLRKQSVGDQFNELTSLLGSERAQLGGIKGLDRTDVDFKSDLGHGSKFAASALRASTDAASAGRTEASLNTKALDLTVANRRVDAGFGHLADLADKDANLLASLRGYNESEVKGVARLSTALKVNFDVSDARGVDGLEQSKAFQNFFAEYNPDKTLKVNWTREARSDSYLSGSNYTGVLNQIELFKDFGRIGKIHLLEAKDEVQGGSLVQPGMVKSVFGYETKLDARTTISTERSHTEYQDGGKETTSTNSLSTSLTKTTGVTVSDITVDRGDESHDERKRAYGVWHDFGNGLKFSYGYGETVEGTTSTDQTSLGLTGGTAGAVKVDSSTTSGQAWNSGRNLSTSNVGISSSHPLKIGSLSDLKFNFSMDAASDWSTWQRDKRLGAFSGKIGGSTFSLLYQSQVDPATGDHGVDRMIRYATDDGPNRRVFGSFGYKLRTLPGDQQVMIRDVNLTGRLSKDFELSDTIVTNPETPRPDAILGTTTAPTKVAKYKLAYKKGANFQIAGSFDEAMTTGTSVNRLAGITFTFNQGAGSPLSFFFGGETTEANSIRKSLRRFETRYDQKAGPNQQFSLVAGNVSYDYTPGQNFASGVSLRVNYQIKF